jgi:predicted transcriptional regulator
VLTRQLPENGGMPADVLAELLQRDFDYKIEAEGLGKYPELQNLRSVFNPRKRRLMLNPRLNERQKAFQLAKELGFNVLGLRERPLASNLLRVNSFEEALNNYKAAYFAVALLVNRQAFVRDLRHFFQQSVWNPQVLLGMMQKFQASPEVLFQRFNVLSREFDLHKVFFLRFIHDLERNGFDIDKELHLNRRHQPHATGLNEHYCRRWLSISLLNDLHTLQKTTGEHPQMVAGIQRARFIDTEEEYLCFAVAKPGYPTADRNVSVTLGILLDETARETIRFWNDPGIPRIEVNVTCQRCLLPSCEQRAAKPVVAQRIQERKAMQEVLKKIVQ